MFGDSEYCEYSESASWPRRDLSGFQRQFVGFVVGFLDQPDKRLPSAINQLVANCRVCRVILGRERSGEFTTNRRGSQTISAGE
jgi:hypothetical protein